MGMSFFAFYHVVLSYQPSLQHGQALERCFLGVERSKQRKCHPSKQLGQAKDDQVKDVGLAKARLWNDGIFVAGVSRRLLMMFLSCCFLIKEVRRGNNRNGSIALVWIGRHVQLAATTNGKFSL